MAGLDDGTGPVAAHLPSRARREQPALDMLHAHIAAHPGYAAWSGGKDSTVAVHLARRVQADIPVVWFDSGLEYPENRDYIHRLAADWNLNLHIIEAVPDALTLLQSAGEWEHGLAPAKLGAHHPRTFHDALITAPARIAHTRYGPGEITGLRAGESVGRRILLARHHGQYDRADGTHVCAPIWRWPTLTVEGYLAAHQVPVNPVYAKLWALGAPEHAQRVGLVVDGNAAQVGRYTWLRAGWPDLWAALTDALPRLNEWR